MNIKEFPIDNITEKLNKILKYKLRKFGEFFKMDLNLAKDKTFRICHSFHWVTEQKD